MKILCDTHAHTVASTHAYSTVHDYVRDAKLNGLQLISITDHAPTMPDAPHFWHFGNMKILPRVMDGIAILRGIEANILKSPFTNTKDRYVDIPDGLLPYLDFAIASFHEPVFAPGNKKENTTAMIRAIESGVIQIVGHPGNPNFPIDYEEVIRAAKDHNVVLEVNNSSLTTSRKGSAPNCEAIVELVDKHDWKISLSSDSHFSQYIGKFDEALAMLERVGFDEKNIITKTPQRFLEFLKEHDKPVQAELSSWASELAN